MEHKTDKLRTIRSKYNIEQENESPPTKKSPSEQPSGYK